MKILNNYIYKMEEIDYDEKNHQQKRMNQKIIIQKEMFGIKIFQKKKYFIS